MSNCEQGSCEAPKHETTKTDCPATNVLLSDCCPVEGAAAMWIESFPCAMKATIVDILKEKIRKAWGSHLDKEADLVVEAMGSVWQTHLAQGKAKCDLREGFKKLYEDLGKGKK